VRSTRLLKLNPKTAIKISNRIVERKFIIAKILFLSKANTKIARDFESPLGRARSARKPPKSMGGAVRRPRNGWSKIRKSNLGVYLRFRSNLLYQKFLMLTSAPLQARHKTARACGQKFPPPNPLHFYPLAQKARRQFMVPIFSLRDRDKLLHEHCRH